MTPHVSAGGVKQGGRLATRSGRARGSLAMLKSVA